MTSLMKSLVVTAAAAGVSYLWRNRNSLPSLRSLRTAGATSDPARGVTIYDNHPVAE
jgi:hypothetical protein